MTKTKAYTLSLSMLIFQACLFYLWQFQGIEQAGNILRASIVTIAVLEIAAACLFMFKEGQVDLDPAVGPKWFGAIAFVKMFALCWAGAFWVYGIYMVSLIFITVRRMENRNRIEAKAFADEQIAEASRIKPAQ